MESMDVWELPDGFGQILHQRDDCRVECTGLHHLFSAADVGTTAA